MTLQRRLTTAAALVLATGALAACGDDEKSSSSGSGSESTPAATSESSGGGGATIDVKAEEPGEEQYAFSPKKLTAKAGEVTIKMDNPSGNQAPHTVVVEAPGFTPGAPADPGGSAEGSGTLKAGKYTFFCPVGDHRAEGMEGTLTVE